MKQFLKFLTKLKGFWKIYSGYGYDGETVEFIIDNYTQVLENRTHTMSKPTYHAKDVISELDNYYNSIKKDGDKIFVNYNMRRKEYTLEQIETIVRAHEDMQDCKEHAGEHLHSEEYVKMFILRREVDRLKEINKEKDEVVEKLKKDSEEMKKRIGRMRVQMANKIYEMTAKQYKGFLKVVKGCLPVGIYAVEKDGVAIMMNEKPKDKEGLRKQVEDFKKKGFRVHWNDFGAIQESKETSNV